MKSTKNLNFGKILSKESLDILFPCNYCLTPAKYFNQQRVNCSQTFSWNSDCVFFWAVCITTKKFA